MKNNNNNTNAQIINGIISTKNVMGIISGLTITKTGVVYIKNQKSKKKIK
jgi:hypothetical protein